MSACPCGAEHPGDVVFFVSVCRNGIDYVPLLGPYPTHPEALSLVDKGRELGERIDPRACWYAFGTMSLPNDTTRKGLLNDVLAAEEEAAKTPKRASMQVVHYRQTAS